MKNKSPILLMDEKEFQKTLEKLADDILKEFRDDPNFVLIGIRTRGVLLAQRLQQIIKARTKKEPLLGTLDITLYRDDLSTLAKHPIVHATTLPFDVDEKKIVLTDDVLYTGRTVRAALDQLVDFGRPSLIRLAVFIDRGMREYPIQADFIGRKIETKQNQVVHVCLPEVDGELRVIIVEGQENMITNPE